MANVIFPRVKAMVLCDNARENQQELGAYRLDGVRTKLGASSFPAFCPLLTVFLQMSGHPGEVSCQIEIERVESDEQIITTVKKKVLLTGPLAVVPVVFRIRNCVFPNPGLYYVQAYVEAKLLFERSMQVFDES